MHSVLSVQLVVSVVSTAAKLCPSATATATAALLLLMLAVEVRGLWGDEREEGEGSGAHKGRRNEVLTPLTTWLRYRQHVEDTAGRFEQKKSFTMAWSL